MYQNRITESGYCEVTQWFGGTNNHRGLDIVGKGYTIDNVVSHSKGKVTKAVTGYLKGNGEGTWWRYGNHVIIEHDNGSTSLYAHLQSTSLKVGERIEKDQLIGRMGTSGNSNGVHLHFELWNTNNYNSNIDPTPYLNADYGIQLNIEYYPKTPYIGVSIVDGLKAIGVDSSKENRMRIALKNGINNYTYTAEENTKMLNLLKQGKLIKS